MTLLVTVYVKEGIIMASDSRISFDETQIINDSEGCKAQTIKRCNVHYSDTSYKLFVTKSGVGISACGAASINNSPIAGYIDTFVRENANTSVTEIPNKLLEYVTSLDPNLESEFHIAGYFDNNGLLEQKAYRVFTSPNTPPDNKIEIINTTEQGAMWNGETDVVSRLISQELYLKSTDQGRDIYMIHAGHGILWQYFTLQDAIDFAESAIKTTIDCIRFQQRPKTVGGPIDILLIKPDGHRWITQKVLHV
ncbi:MAG: hypothetical protein PHD33_06670 [Atribacterota bacterium]|nr:hypothetical protein [Atribacterota bacterium]